MVWVGGDHGMYMWCGLVVIMDVQTYIISPMFSVLLCQPVSTVHICLYSCMCTRVIVPNFVVGS